jgi:hypothetical protein
MPIRQDNITVDVKRRESVVLNIGIKLRAARNKVIFYHIKTVSFKRGILLKVSYCWVLNMQGVIWIN